MADTRLASLFYYVPGSTSLVKPEGGTCAYLQIEPNTLRPLQIVVHQTGDTRVEVRLAGEAAGKELKPVCYFFDEASGITHVFLTEVEQYHSFARHMYPANVTILREAAGIF